MNGFFITGTDTGVGKTVVSALFCLALDADYFKPIQTGPAQDHDTPTVAALTGLTPERLHSPAHALPAPLSPDQAARLAGVRLDVAAIDLPRAAPPRTGRPLIVEGAGGALVPIAPGQDMTDLMARFGLPVVVAARSGLGTINHTLLTLEALRLRGLDVAGVVLCGPPDPANRQDIERLGRVDVLAEIPRLDPLDRAALTALVPTLRLPPFPDRAAQSAQVLEWDARHVWHPFTQAATAPAPTHLVRARGATLRTADGRDLTDLVSSWWVNAHGHAHPEVAAAIARQCNTLEQALFADFTHEPAARLAHALCALLPGDLSRVFFSDNGSTAVEVALKMARQYWANQGQAGRTRIAAFHGGYHGDTVGAMSVGRSSGFYAGFASWLFQVDFLPYPATWLGDDGAGQRADQALKELATYLERNRGQVAAVLMEPLVQGASGMNMTEPGFVAQAARLAREHGVLLILDEVMTGFGRTGTMFACQRCGVEPDIVCLSKALTAGFLPMGLTVATESIYRGFLGQTFDRALAHGHSFTANPLGCAAALAGLELFRRENTLERIARLEAVHARRLTALAGHPRLTRPRWRGSIGAVDVRVDTPGYEAAVGKRIKAFFLERGQYVRPLGNVFYMMPPYCLKPGELDHAYDTLEEALESLE
uniref:Multifunctional fusion protein n=1 Tax=Fundidesulfovibrio putealis TaxID=270496 RepID=A0A7C4EHF6_9BACT